MGCMLWRNGCCLCGGVWPLPDVKRQACVINCKGLVGCAVWLGGPKGRKMMGALHGRTCICGGAISHWPGAAGQICVESRAVARAPLPSSRLDRHPPHPQRPPPHTPAQQRERAPHLSSSNPLKNPARPALPDASLPPPRSLACRLTPLRTARPPSSSAQRTCLTTSSLTRPSPATVLPSPSCCPRARHARWARSWRSTSTGWRCRCAECMVTPGHSG